MYLFYDENEIEKLQIQTESFIQIRHSDSTRFELLRKKTKVPFRSVPFY